MTRDLRFSNQVFGFGSGIFFLGYLVLEIPGAILVERWSARKWIARIMISWGVVAALTAFIRTAPEFYTARLLLGLAEAGFFPGILVYLSHWFRQEDRAKAVAWFMIGIPISEIIGAPLSGLLLGVHWLGLEGWRWLFLLEGAPAILLGMVTLAWLTDRPEDARWLAPEERGWITKQLEEERARKPPSGGVGKILLHPSLILLALAYFCILTSTYGFTLWLPRIVQQLSGLPSLEVTLITAIPFLIEIPVMVSLAWHSDKTGERRWHVAIPVGIGGLAFAFFAINQRAGSNVLEGIVVLTIAAAGLHGYRAAFWTLPTVFLKETGAAAGIGVINCFGNLGAFLGPSMVGVLSNKSGTYGRGVLFLGGAALLASMFVLLVRAEPGRASP